MALRMLCFAVYRELTVNKHEKEDDDESKRDSERCWLGISILATVLVLLHSPCEAVVPYGGFPPP